MRTKPLPDPATVSTAAPPQRVDPRHSDETQAYVASALRVEMMALHLAKEEAGDDEAVAELIEAAGGDVRVMRRAHRHCELALSEQWPAGRTLIRAFDYLNTGRQELETRIHASAASTRSVVVGRSTRPPVSSEVVYDLVEEAGIESFPASDAPSFWGR